MEVVAVAEDGRAVGRLIRPLALEPPGSVMEPVRQYVDLRVLPGDELSVVPDEVSLLHLSGSLEVFEYRLGGLVSCV